MNFLGDVTGNILSAHEKGDEIIACLHDHSRRLENLIRVTQAITERDEYVRRVGNGVIAADGTAEIRLEIRLGFVAELVGFATSSTSAIANSLVAFYMNSTESGQNLIYGGPNGIVKSDTFPVGTLLPEGAPLICRFTGGTPGDVVTAAINAKRLRLHTPHAVDGVPY